MESIDKLLSEFEIEVTKMVGRTAAPSSIDQLLRQMKTAQQASAPDPAMVQSNQQACENNLFSEQKGRMSNLVALLSAIAEFAGAGGCQGFLNPSTTFCERTRQGEYDEMPMVQYETAVETATEAAKLWEGQRVARAFPLARNALLYAVLSDEALFEEVYKKTERQLKEWGDTLRELNG